MTTTASLVHCHCAAIPAHGNHDGHDTTDAIAALLHAAGLRPIEVWIHELEHTFTPETFWQMRTGCGCNRARLAAIDPTTRDQIMPEVRRRLDQLAPSDYTFHGKVICSVSDRTS